MMFFLSYSDVHKKCKCGRRLGHPPVYDGPDACKRNSKMNTISVDNKYKNLKIDVSDSNNTNGNKKNKNKEIKYKTIS